LPQNPDDQPAEPKAKHSAAFWFKQLDAADKREKSWRKQGSEVQCRYLDDRKGYDGGDVYERRVNILWANTELQKGALFGNLGNPDVRRGFPKPGRDNKIARTAALVLERALVACNNRYDPECQIEDAVEDQLLPGRGVCWLEYDAKVEDYTETVMQADPVTGEQVEAEQTSERITYQDARFCHVEWKDFRHGSAKRWEDVPWVARLKLFTKEDIAKTWPDMADQVKCDYVVEDEQTGNKRGDKDQDFRRAKVWEVWYKPKKIRVYVAEGTDAELSREEDPYRLEKFFPCEKPLYGVKTTSSLIPKPEFLQYKDQADELDRINTRIWRLLEKLRYCGVYDASGEDSDALEGIGDLEDGQFKPYKNFRALAEGGGLAAAFQVRDLAPIAAAIQTLAQRAMVLIQSIYEVTGLSDVMRGATDPNETLGAQDLKARFGSTRMQTKQATTRRFVSGLYKLKAELIAEHFEREQLEEMTGIRLPLAADRDAAKQMVKASEQAQAAAQQMQQAQQSAQPGQPPAPRQMPAMQPPLDPLAGMDPEDAAEIREIADSSSWEEIAAILRSDDRRNYKITVETDAVNYQETEEEKKQRLEFVNVMIGLLSQVMMAAQANPALWTLAKELVMFASRAFKIGRTLEETIDDTFQQMMKTPPQQQAQADPLAEARKADMEAKVASQQAKNQLDQQAGQMRLAAEQAQHAMDLELAQEKHRTAMLLERVAQTKANTELMSADLGVSDPQIRARDVQLREDEAMQRRRESEHGMMGQDADRAHAQTIAQQDIEGRAEDRALKREQAAQRQPAMEEA
jgi:hypothetical protein